MKSKILTTTLVGLLFGLVACDKPQEKPAQTKQENQPTEQVEQQNAVSKTEDSNENSMQDTKTETQTDADAKDMQPIKTTPLQGASSIKQQSAENQAKIAQAKKLAEKAEKEKILAILEKQYQNVRCPEGNESGYCLEESQRLEREINQLKSELDK